MGSQQLQPEQQQNDASFGLVEPQAPEAVTGISTVTEEPAAPPSDPALLSMNILSGQPQSLVTEPGASESNGPAAGSMADQAYAKLVNMDAFDLVQAKDTESRKNPFDAAGTTSTSIGSNAATSLADMMKSKKPTE